MVEYAAGDTWGIGSATFAVAYALLAAAAVAGALLHRHRALAGSDRMPAADPHPQQVAYLQGGPELATYSALAALRCAGAVGVATDPAETGERPRRRLVATGPPPDGATALERAVHDAAARSADPGAVAADPAVATELARVEREMESAGLVPDADTHGALTTARHLLTAVLVLGVARLLAGIANEKSIIFLMLVLLALGATIAVLWRKRPRRTRAGDRVLAALREDHSHLAPPNNPAWQVYGPAAAALAVGLYGSNALWVADPGFAAEAAVRKDLATAYANSTSSTGSGTAQTCSGSSCGCGSGSGGGSDSGGGTGGSGGGGGGGCGG
ncbi:TIGR04222 domain-containing membrane protein [Phytohabitans sp. LJ34]|uniref:TIGR04222 domain-containing membrane protein n=1 Tax=Phytohabitans sp. LJ34 TaxID=3452217 RepID=UPI003F8C6E46